MPVKSPDDNVDSKKAKDDKLEKREITMPDGRYMIFYTHKKETGNAGDKAIDVRA